MYLFSLVILVYPSFPHVHLYCTYFSIPSPFLCLLPLPLSISTPPLSDLSEWRLRINRRLFHSELSNRNAYIWSLTPHRTVTELQVHKWATVICKELWRWRLWWWWWGYMPTIMRVCASSKVGGCATVHMRKQEKKSLNAKSVRQCESDSVSFCLVMCVRQCCC